MAKRTPAFEPRYLGLVLLAGGALGGVHVTAPTGKARSAGLVLASDGEARLAPASHVELTPVDERVNVRTARPHGIQLGTPSVRSARRRVDVSRVEEWIEDLRNDGERGNARRAYYELLEAGDAARAPLLAALDSHDYQQRQLAALVLGKLGGAPSDRLIDVVVEGLAHDTLPFEPGPDPEQPGVDGFYSSVARNAEAGVGLLVSWGDRCWQRVSRSVRSSDEQQRFASALVLAHTAWPDEAWRVTSVLASHLRDNQQPGDANEAYFALLRYGRLAQPHLEVAASSADHQARRILTLLQQEIEAPSRSDEERARRKTELGLEGMLHTNSTSFAPGERAF